MSVSKQRELDDAISALQPFYDPDDDGYPVSLALDAIAGILGDSVGIEVTEDHGLTPLLERLAAPDDLIEAIKKLYENAAGGEYGVGLSKLQAKVINDTVQEAIEPLTAFLSEFSKPRRSTTTSRKRARKKRP